MTSRDATHTREICPLVLEHKSSANIYLLEREDGSRFCAVHGNWGGRPGERVIGDREGTR